jgi:cysteine synthase
MIHSNVLELIGDTPIVRLNRIPGPQDAEVACKVESLNPGGSIKDRIGLRIIEDAERRGLLKPGGVVVEATPARDWRSCASSGATARSS